VVWIKDLVACLTVIKGEKEKGWKKEKKKTKIKCGKKKHDETYFAHKNWYKRVIRV